MDKYYPPFALTVSKWQMINLKFLSELIEETMLEEDTEYSNDISLIFSDECMSFVIELYLKSNQVFESIYLHESVIRILFLSEERNFKDSSEIKAL
jgi:hypothetical protein